MIPSLTMEANSRVITRFLNEAYKSLREASSNLDEAFELLNTLYLRSWEAWLDLLDLLPDIDLTLLRERFSELMDRISEFMENPTEDSYANMYASYLSFMSEWNSVEGKLRNSLSERLNLRGYYLSKKHWELALLIVLKGEASLSAKVTDVLLKHLPALWSFRRTYHTYLDISMGQFIMPSNELRQSLSPYFKLLAALEKLRKQLDPLELNFSLLIRGDELPNYWRALARELALLELDTDQLIAQLEDEVDKFWRSLDANVWSDFIRNMITYEDNVRGDLNYYTLSSIPLLVELLPKYVFVVENVQLPDEEAELLRDMLKIAFSTAEDYISGLLITDELEDMVNVFKRALRALEEITLGLTETYIDDYLRALGVLSDAIYTFSREYQDYRSSLEQRKYFPYLMDLVLRVHLMYVPSYTLVIEAGRIRTTALLDADVDKISYSLPPYVKLTEEERERYLSALSSLGELARALEDYALQEDISEVQRAWRKLLSDISFLRSVLEKLEKQREEFEKEVSSLLKEMGLREVENNLVKFLAYLYMSYQKGTEREETLEELADRVAAVIEESLNKLQENLPAELPEELGGIQEVLELSEEMLSSVDAFLRDKDLENLKRAIEIGVKLEPVLKELQTHLMDELVNLQQRLDELRGEPKQ